MHAHSFTRSRDSGISGPTLVEHVAARGLDGVTLTEHNAIWPADEARELSERYEVVALPAMELGTDVGHVLVYGLDHYSIELLRAEILRPIVLAEGAAMVWAHPMRQVDGRRASWQEVPELFEALEVVNGDHSDRADGYYASLTRELGVGRTAGSDVHSIPAIGRVGTVFPEPVPDLETLVRLLREQQQDIFDFRTAAYFATAR